MQMSIWNSFNKHKDVWAPLTGAGDVEDLLGVDEAGHLDAGVDADELVQRDLELAGDLHGAGHNGAGAGRGGREAGGRWLGRR